MPDLHRRPRPHLGRWPQGPRGAGGGERRAFVEHVARPRHVRS
jgi:hypothetical protein